MSARYSCILFCTHDDGVRALNVRGDDDDGTPFHTSVPTAFFPRFFFLKSFFSFFFFFIFAAFRILNATFFACGQYKFKKQPQTSRSRAACITYLTGPVTYIAHVVDNYNTIPAYRIDQQSSVIAQANKSYSIICMLKSPPKSRSGNYFVFFYGFFFTHYFVVLD